MKKLVAVVSVCLALCGCDDTSDRAKRVYWKQAQDNKDDIVEADWKMLGGNSHIYFTTFMVDGHKYIVATRSYDCITLQHAASCSCKQEK